MAITRSQQAKQLLAQGGRIGLQGGGKDMSTVSAADIGIGKSTDKREYTPEEKKEQRDTDRLNQQIKLKDEVRKQEKEKLEEKLEKFRRLGSNTRKFQQFAQKFSPLAKFVSRFGPLNNRDFFLDKVLGSKNFSDLTREDFASLTEDEKEELYDSYMSDRMSGQTDAYGNLINTDRGGEGGQQILPPIINEVKEEEVAEYVNPLSLLTPRIAGSRFLGSEFAADGGRMGAMSGGIASLDREAFLLGGIAKGLKKATRAVKKIAKSPIGKAALFYGLSAMGGSFGAGKGLFSKGMFNPGNIARGLLGTKGVGMDGGTLGLFGKFGLTEGFGAMMPTIKGGITLASILPLLAGKTEEEKDDILKEYYASQKLEPATTARQAGSEFDFYNYNLAEGGMPSKEPVAKKVMPLLDMDGMEKDYRAEGGFVPIGRMEKADDVPARLSKNEFVFTADAVRNAGEGDVDKGAEVMYNMMKNLESGGEVSEESQGLDGAREMFQTSQRLGEVI